MAAHSSRAAHLEVHVEVPSRDVVLDLVPRPGLVTAVIGPNGAGKSTLLGAIGGSVPARGSIRLDAEEIIPRAVHRRGVTHLRQDPVLFDHLSVLENVAFGPLAQGAGRAQARRRAEDLLAQLDIAELRDRRPRRVSGGQAQRVALARALASDPRLILLDEPFAALDAQASARLRGLAGTFFAGRTVLLVTHDLLDVLALADDLVVLEGGRVIHHGVRDAVLARPRTAFAARLLGKELLTGTIGEDATGEPVLRLPSGADVPGVPEGGLGTGDQAVMLLDPSGVGVRSSVDPVASGEHEVRIEALDRLGPAILVRGGGLVAQVAPEQILSRRLGIGSTVRMLLDPMTRPIYAGADDHESAP